MGDPLAHFLSHYSRYAEPGKVISCWRFTVNEQGLSETELRQLLSIIGASRFLRYRKRFSERHIARTILLAEPDLTLGEAERVVMAGRRIVDRGMGLAALAMAKNGDIQGAGRWPLSKDLAALGQSLLVNLGGLTVLAYLALGLMWSASS
jgi:hypothetical protein